MGKKAVAVIEPFRFGELGQFAERFIVEVYFGIHNAFGAADIRPHIAAEPDGFTGFNRFNSRRFERFDRYVDIVNRLSFFHGTEKFYRVGSAVRLIRRRRID